MPDWDAPQLVGVAPDGNRVEHPLHRYPDAEEAWGVWRTLAKVLVAGHGREMARKWTFYVRPPRV